MWISRIKWAPSSSAVSYLLGFLRHHEHQIEVVRSQGVFVQIVHVDQEQEVLQGLFGAHGVGTFRRVHWTNTQTQQCDAKLKLICCVSSNRETRSTFSPRSSWTFCKAISNSGTVFFTWVVKMDKKNLTRWNQNASTSHLKLAEASTVSLGSTSPAHCFCSATTSV